jgi:hypothetical protein
VHPDRMVQPLFKMHSIFTQATSSHRPCYDDSSLNDVEDRQSITQESFFWGPSTRHTGRLASDNSQECPTERLQSVRTQTSDPKYQKFPRCWVYKCSECGDVMWFVHTQPTRAPEITYSLNNEAVFPLESWHPLTRLQDATCQKFLICVLLGSYAA